MAQGQSYACDDCGHRTEDGTYPLVTYVVVGSPPLHPEVNEGVANVTGYPLPQSVRNLLSKPVPRHDRCLLCYAWERGEDLVDGEGNTVVKHRDHTSRQTFGAAAVSVVKAARAMAAAQRATADAPGRAAVDSEPEPIPSATAITDESF